MLLVDFFDHGDTLVSAECFCGAHGRLWPSTCHERSGLLF
jgi:hypothetical protein